MSNQGERRGWGDKARAVTAGIPSEVIFAPSKRVDVTDADLYLDKKTRAEVDDIIYYLLNYERFGRLGYRGVILKGPPGTGKTMIAWYIATKVNANVYFYESTSGIRVEDYWKKLFEAARQKSLETSQWSVIFVDEADSVLPKREDVVDTTEMKGVSQILRQMDSLHGYEKELMDPKWLCPKFKLLVIGATNRPDSIDPAARRPGRFDAEVEILAPDKDGRREIFNIHRNMETGFELSDEVRDYAVEKTPGYTGGDLRGVFQKACAVSLREFMTDKNAKLKENKLIVLENKHIDYAVKRQPPSGLKGLYFKEPTVSFKDIIGHEDQKRTLELLVVDPFRDPDSYEKCGLKPERGVILYGPSGMKKTELAMAVAKEAGTNLMFISGPELHNKFFGESERIIRDIMQKAQYAQPTVVVFDMIDTLVGRKDLVGSATYSIRGQLLNSLMQIPDGVVIIGTTHNPEMIGSEFMRPETLGCKIYIGPPDKDDRVAYFTRHLEPIQKKEVDYSILAEKTNGYSCSAIEKICENAKRWYTLNSKKDKVILTQAVMEKLIARYPYIPEDENKWKEQSDKLGTESLGVIYDIR